jgi:hypothetical protein
LRRPWSELPCCWRIRFLGSQLRPRSRTLTVHSAVYLNPKYCAAYPVLGRCARTGFKWRWLRI